MMLCLPQNATDHLTPVHDNAPVTSDGAGGLWVKALAEILNALEKKYNRLHTACVSMVNRNTFVVGLFTNQLCAVVVLGPHQG